MILIDLEHAGEQVRLGAAFGKAIQWLRWAREQNLPDGRVEIDGERIYGVVQSYDSLPQPEVLRFEGHRKYIDLQYIVEGEELMHWALASRVTPSQPYDAAKDVWFGPLAAARSAPVRVAAGELAVFFPIDAHAPKIAVSKPAAVKKIVVKLAIAS